MKKFLVVMEIASFVALTACGQAENPGIASVGGAASSASPSVSTQADGLKFAQCMRENDVDMPDPEPGGNAVMIRGKADVKALENASKACKKYNQIGSGKGMLKNPENQDAIPKFAKCMRENGVDMKDPDFSGGQVTIGGKGMNTGCLRRGPYLACNHRTGCRLRAVTGPWCPGRAVRRSPGSPPRYDGPPANIGAAG
jgi:hypothetical protein